MVYFYRISGTLKKMRFCAFFAVRLSAEWDEGGKVEVKQEGREGRSTKNGPLSDPSVRPKWPFGESRESDLGG